MARVRQVTRTVKVSNVRYLMVNTETGETFWDEKKVPGTFKNEEKLIEAIGNVGDNMKVVKANVVSVDSVKYSIPESFFIENAVESPCEMVGKDTTNANQLDTATQD